MGKWVGVAMVVIALAGAGLLHLSYAAGPPRCPYCDSPLVWTPLGTKSENFLWICLADGTRWTKTYDERTFKAWKEEIPEIIRDAVLLYIARKHPDAADLLNIGGKWVKVGGKTIKFEKDGLTVEEAFLDDLRKARVDVDFRHQGVGIPHRIIWTGYFDNGEIAEEKYLHAY